MPRIALILLILCISINAVPLFSKEKCPTKIEINAVTFSTPSCSDTTFSTTAKISAVVMGSFFGFFIGGTIGALSIERSDDRIGGVLIGGGIGVIVGPFLNYFIISQLAKKEAKRQKEATKAWIPKLDMRIRSNSTFHHSKYATLSLNIGF